MALFNWRNKNKKKGKDQAGSPASDTEVLEKPDDMSVTELFPAGFMINNQEAFAEDEQKLQAAKEAELRKALDDARQKAEDEQSAAEDAEVDKQKEQNLENESHEHIPSSSTFDHSLDWYICSIYEVEINENLLVPYLRGGPMEIQNVSSAAEDVNKPDIIFFIDHSDNCEYILSKSRVHTKQTDISPQQANNLAALAALNPKMQEDGVVPTGPIETQAMLIVAASFHGLKIALDENVKIPQEVLENAQREFEAYKQSAADYVNSNTAATDSASLNTEQDTEASAPEESAQAPEEVEVTEQEETAQAPEEAEATEQEEAAQAPEEAEVTEQEETAQAPEEAEVTEQEETAQAPEEAEVTEQEEIAAADNQETPRQEHPEDEEAIEALVNELKTFQKEKLGVSETPETSEQEETAQAPEEAEVTEQEETAQAPEEAEVTEQEETAQAPEEAEVTEQEETAQAPEETKTSETDKDSSEISKETLAYLEQNGLTAAEFNKAADFVRNNNFSRLKIEKLFNVGKNKAYAIRDALRKEGHLVRCEKGNFHSLYNKDGTRKSEEDIPVKISDEFYKAQNSQKKEISISPPANDTAGTPARKSNSNKLG